MSALVQGFGAETLVVKVVNPFEELVLLKLAAVHFTDYRDTMCHFLPSNCTIALMTTQCREIVSLYRLFMVLKDM